MISTLHFSFKHRNLAVIFFVVIFFYFFLYWLCQTQELWQITCSEQRTGLRDLVKGEGMRWNWHYFVNTKGFSSPRFSKGFPQAAAPCLEASASTRAWLPLQSALCGNASEAGNRRRPPAEQSASARGFHLVPWLRTISCRAGECSIAGVCSRGQVISDHASLPFRLLPPFLPRVLLWAIIAQRQSRFPACNGRRKAQFHAPNRGTWLAALEIDPSVFQAKVLLAYWGSWKGTAVHSRQKTLTFNSCPQPLQLRCACRCVKRSQRERGRERQGVGRGVKAKKGRRDSGIEAGKFIESYQTCGYLAIVSA